jgi:hypothetical protein
MAGFPLKQQYEAGNGEVANFPYLLPIHPDKGRPNS